MDYPRGAIDSVARHLALATVDEIIYLLRGCCIVPLQFFLAQARIALDNIPTARMASCYPECIMLKAQARMGGLGGLSQKLFGMRNEPAQFRVKSWVVDSSSAIA